MTRGGWAIALFLILVGGICVAQSEPQSLADIAKRSRSEKKSASTFSDDNFVRQRPAVEAKSSAGIAASDARASAGEQQSSSVKPAEGNAKTGKAAEALNKEELKKEELKKQLDSYKAARDGWNKSAKRYEDLLENEHDEFRRQMYEDALNNDRQNVSVYQKKIDESEAKMGSNSGDDSAKTDQAAPGGNKP
jgi:hypothetical protein